jgi:hypothetical protein
MTFVSCFLKPSFSYSWLSTVRLTCFQMPCTLPMMSIQTRFPRKRWHKFFKSFHRYDLGHVKPIGQEF